MLCSQSATFRPTVCRRVRAVFAVDFTIATCDLHVFALRDNYFAACLNGRDPRRLDVFREGTNDYSRLIAYVLPASDPFNERGDKTIRETSHETRPLLPYVDSPLARLSTFENNDTYFSAHPFSSACVCVYLSFHDRCYDPRVKRTKLRNQSGTNYGAKILKIIFPYYERLISERSTLSQL